MIFRPPPDGQPGEGRWGTMFNACGITMIPQALLIDAEGAVIGRGPVEEVIGQALRIEKDRRRSEAATKPALKSADR